MEISPEEADTPAICARLRVVFSNLGFARFFVDGTQRWEILPATFGLLAESDKALLCGARTPGLLSSFLEAVERQGCEAEIVQSEMCPDIVGVSGAGDSLLKVSQALGLPFGRDLPLQFARYVEPILRQVENALREEAPRNWEMKRFDLSTLSWIDGIGPRSCCEFTPAHGNPVYFITKRDGSLFRLGKAESIYASANLHGVTLVDYDQDLATLSVPLAAPLPEAYARVASLCSGDLPGVVDGRFLYKGVPQHVAGLLMVSLGQRYPDGVIQNLGRR